MCGEAYLHLLGEGGGVICDIWSEHTQASFPKFVTQAPSSLTLARAFFFTLSLSRARALSFLFSVALARACARALTFSLFLSRSHIRTRTYAHAHAHKYTHTRTHTRTGIETREYGIVSRSTACTLLCWVCCSRVAVLALQYIVCCSRVAALALVCRVCCSHRSKYDKSGHAPTTHTLELQQMIQLGIAAIAREYVAVM